MVKISLTYQELVLADYSSSAVHHIHTLHSCHWYYYHVNKGADSVVLCEGPILLVLHRSFGLICIFHWMLCRNIPLTAVTHLPV